MIGVHRGPAPGILVRKVQKWLDAWRKAGTPAKRKRALERYKHEQVRDALRDLFHGKCAYCETKTEVATWGHIEHYRPKSRFPKAAFDWDNLLWACPRCNSECKGEQFPEAADGGPVLDPCDDEPSDHLFFDYDPIARLASVYGKTTRGQTTVDLLQLNRPELRAQRSRQVSHLAALAVFAQGNADARRLLDEAEADDAPYAAFARAANW
jgi:uncharacterized protein (TIGR02646 family)